MQATFQVSRCILTTELVFSAMLTPPYHHSAETICLSPQPTLKWSVQVLHTILESAVLF